MGNNFCESAGDNKGHHYDVFQIIALNKIYLFTKSIVWWYDSTADHRPNDIRNLDLLTCRQPQRTLAKSNILHILRLCNKIDEVLHFIEWQSVHRCWSFHNLLWTALFAVLPGIVYLKFWQTCRKQRRKLIILAMDQSILWYILVKGAKHSIIYATSFGPGVVNFIAL